MNILIDRHHEGLTESLYTLFEKRLGHTVYVQIGMDWFYQGYWAINNQVDTARQFLLENSIPADGTMPLNYVQNRVIPRETYNQRVIEYNAFLNTPFDLIIASIPQHIEPFRRLAALKGAKFAVQLGNEWDLPLYQGMNILAAIEPRVLSDYVNAVFYHEEFDKNTYHPNLSEREKKIYTFVNVLKEKPKDYQLFLELEKLMPDFEFKMFGGQNRDGSINSQYEIARLMRECAFLFHCKTGGDGYGFIMHQGAYAGCPVITRASDYNNKLASSLLDNSTAVSVDGRSAKEIADILYYLYETKEYIDMSKNIHDKAKIALDFDAEELKIRNWLNNMI